MIVYAPEITVQNGEVIISARIEMRTPVPGLPERFWYAYPEAYVQFIPAHGDAFAASLLLTAMYFWEDLEVRAPVSARLAYGLGEYQAAMQAWFPRVFQAVKLDLPLTGAQLDDSRPHVCASAFSGGVDSCYTLLSHLPPNQTIPAMQPSHVILSMGWTCGCTSGISTRRSSSVIGNPSAGWGSS